jgi:hypothetical protein
MESGNLLLRVLLGLPIYVFGQLQLIVFIIISFRFNTFRCVDADKKYINPRSQDCSDVRPNNRNPEVVVIGSDANTQIQTKLQTFKKIGRPAHYLQKIHLVLLHVGFICLRSIERVEYSSVL